MYPFWPTIIQPLVNIARPKHLVEIGSEAGYNLANLLTYAVGHDAHVHAIDPKPLFKVDQWIAKTGGRLTVHRDISLNVLPTLDAFDMVFVDGDHNWYTVFTELKLLESRSEAIGQPFPVVMLHDVGWPWGRRDMYYDPSAIPAEHRHPYLTPTKPGAQKSGYHADFSQAKVEGGARNGVLTAVEDFMAESHVPLELTIVPGFAGLGIVMSAAVKEAHPPLAKFVEGLDLPPTMRAYVEDLEGARMRRKLPGR